MTKQTGLGDNLYVGGYNLSGDTAALGTIAGGPAPVEVTGIDKSAFERLGGKIDGRLNLTAYFNDATGQAHDVYSPLPTADVNVAYFRGTDIGAAAAGIVAKQIGYDLNRAADGSLSLTVDVLANGYGIEWGNNLTAGIRTDTAATNGTSIDLGAAQTLGMRAYLHVFAFTGTDATITIQDSANNSTFANVQAFTAVTSAPFTERIETVGTEEVRQYVRARTTTTGGFTNLQFAVIVIQNTTAVTL